MQSLCSRIRFEEKDMKISFDSQSEIFLENNPAYHYKSKHIDVQYHFVRDMVESNDVLLEKVETLETITYTLTISVSAMKLFWCREAMGIASLGL
jgi:hypothetical protein